MVRAGPFTATACVKAGLLSRLGGLMCSIGLRSAMAGFSLRLVRARSGPAAYNQTFLQDHPDVIGPDSRPAPPPAGRGGSQGASRAAAAPPARRSGPCPG